MSYRVVFSPEAQEQLSALFHYIAEAATPDIAARYTERLSQPVFARYMNVSKNLVSDWKRGVKKSGGSALRLLAVVKKRHSVDWLKIPVRSKPC